MLIEKLIRTFHETLKALLSFVTHHNYSSNLLKILNYLEYHNN